MAALVLSGGGLSEPAVSPLYIDIQTNSVLYKILRHAANLISDQPLDIKTFTPALLRLQVWRQRRMLQHVFVFHYQL